MNKIIACAVICIGLLSACQVGPPYDGDHNQEYAQMNENFKVFNHTIDRRNLHGIHAGKACNPAVLFIHGAPGDWQAWGHYLGDADLGDKAFMIALDRPGYGGSITPDAKDLNIKQQSAALIKAALKEHDGPFIVVGHSYGGPIQLQMAMDFPNRIQGMILIAGAIAPDLHKPRWYHYLSNIWPLRTVLPAPLTTATREMLSLHKDLKAQQAHLSDIKTKTVVIQGSKDWLVPPGNTDFAKTTLKNADIKTITLQNQGHFIPWEQYPLVKNEILKMLPPSDC